MNNFDGKNLDCFLIYPSKHMLCVLIQMALLSNHNIWDSP